MINLQKNASIYSHHIAYCTFKKNAPVIKLTVHILHTLHLKHIHLLTLTLTLTACKLWMKQQLLALSVPITFILWCHRHRLKWNHTLQFFKKFFKLCRLNFLQTCYLKWCNPSFPLPGQGWYLCIFCTRVNKLFMQLCHSVFYEVRVTIQTNLISHSCNSNNVNPRAFSVQQVQHNITPCATIFL